MDDDGGLSVLELAWIVGKVEVVGQRGSRSALDSITEFKERGVGLLWWSGLLRWF